MTKKERFEKVIHYFQTERPIAETELEYGSPYELLVAVILSAQCTAGLKVRRRSSLHY